MNIARIKLATGQVGFYDEISGIHLTLSDTEADVAKGSNTAGLINGVACGKIIVIAGTLGEDSQGISKEDVIPAIPTYYRLLEKKKQAALKDRLTRDLTSVKTFVNEVEKKAEEKVEAIEEKIEVVEEVVKKAKTTRKKIDKTESVNIEESKNEEVEEAK